MKHVDLLNEFRVVMSQLATQVEAASAMQMYDIHNVSENLVLGVLRELYGWRHLRCVFRSPMINQFRTS